MNQLEDLLKECTVQIRVPSGSGLGTGFFVASALLLTCDHVVKGSENGVVEARCWGQQQWVKAKVEKSLPKPYDLALVKVVLPESIDHPPCVYLGEEIQSRDPLCSFGFPDEGDQEGEPRTFNSDGTTGSDVASILFKLGQVRPGMSGSALLNQRTGKVCGMVQFTRDRSIDLGGGALTTRVILEQFPELRNLQKEFHQRDLRWREHLKWDGSPYPGLYAFEKADAPIFFGRNDDIQEGIEELRNLRNRKERLFIYLGASGSGKSSLVRAGLVPELEKTHHTKHWIVVSPFRPINEGWGDPFKNLADVLSAAFEEHGTPRDSDSIQEQLSNPRQHHGLLEVVRDLTKVAKQRQATVLIIIDQFEELLGQTASDQAQEFLTWFGEGMVAAQQLPAPMLIVLAVMRSDFLPEFQQSTLQPSVKIFPKLVNPIPVERFGELIEGPANLVGLKLQTGLTQQIVSDANTASSLPLLAFTLAKLYEQYGQDGLLEIKEYETLGKLKGSVSQEAQRIFDRYLAEANLEEEEEGDLLRQAFLKLVRLDANGNAARRLATWQEFPVAAQPLMEKFVEGRLLTKRVNEEKVNSHDIQTQHNLQTLVEVSHEALFTAWPLLRDCIDNSRGHLLDKQKIEATAEEWQATNQSKELLLIEKRLAKAIAFVDTYGQEFPLTEVGQAFVAASQQADAVKAFFQKSRNMARSISIRLKQVLALVAIARAEATADAPKEAQDTLDQALAIARGVGDSAEQGQMLVAIALASRQLSGTDQPLEPIISVANGLPNSIWTIVQAAGQLADPLAAAAVLEKATTAAETINDDDYRHEILYRHEVLCAIAQAAGQVADPLAAAAVLEKATTAAETIDDDSSRHEVLCAIAQAAGQLADPLAAAAVLEKASTAAETIDDDSSQREALCAIAQAAGQLADPLAAAAVLEKATTAAETINDDSSRGKALCAIVQAAGQLADPLAAAAVLEKATTAAETINNNSSRGKALCAIAQAAGQVADPLAAAAVLEKATTAAETINDDSSQREALCAIAQAAGQLDDPLAAAAVLEKASTAAETINNNSSRGKALCAIAQAAGQVADPLAAAAVLEKASTAAETIDDDSSRGKALCAIAQAAGQLADPLAAATVLEKATTAAETIDNNYSRHEALCAIAQAAGQLADPLAAAAVLEKASTAAKTINDDSSRGKALCAIAQAAGQLDDPLAAVAVLEKASTAAETINNNSSRGKALCAIAQAAGQVADPLAAAAVLEKASTAAETIDDDYSQREALCAIAQAYSQVADPRSAAAVLEKATTAAAETIDNNYSRCEALCAIAQAYSQVADPLAAAAVLEKATTAAETIDNNYSRHEALCAIAQAAGQVADPLAAAAVLEKATTAAETIDDDYSRREALCAIVQAAGQLDDPLAAVAVLEKASTAAETIDDDYSQREALCAIAQAAGQLDDPLAAVAVLEKASTAAKTIDNNYSRGKALCAIAQAAGQLADPLAAAAVLEKATTAAETIDNNYSRHEALCAIAQAYSQVADPLAAAAVLEKATTAAETIDNNYSRHEALCAIAQAYSQLADPLAAAAVLEKATTAAETIDNNYSRHEALCAIAQAYSQVADPLAAAAVLEKATTAAETIDNNYSRHEALCAIAQAYSQVADPLAAAAVLEKATTAAETIDDDSSRGKALCAILDVQESLGTSETLLDNLPSAPAELKNVLDNALTDVKDNPQRSNYFRHQALLEIIQALRQCPDTASAKGLLDTTLLLAQALTFPEFRDKVQGAIAVAYGRIAQWEDAFQTLEPFADDEKTEALSQILDLWVAHHNLASTKSDPQPSKTETKTI